MNTAFIVSDPAVMFGKPVIAGTRITVDLILDKLAAGESVDDLLLSQSPGDSCRAVLRRTQLARRNRAGYASCLCVIIVADESVDQPIVDRLRHAGHRVVAVAEVAASLKDDEVLRMAGEHAALLLTQDRDFGALLRLLEDG